MSETVWDRVKARKAELDRLRPLAADALKSLQKHYDVDLTYTLFGQPQECVRVRLTATRSAIAA